MTEPTQPGPPQGQPPGPPPGYPEQGGGMPGEPAPAPAYSAPASHGASGPRANFGYRLLAWLVDLVILSVVGGAVWAITNQQVANVVQLIVGIAYYTYFEGSASGQTVGKKVVGIRVIDFQSGGSIGYGRAVGRYFARILSTLPCLLGYFWMLWDREKQTWHDKLVTSVVVPTSAYPVERWPG